MCVRHLVANELLNGLGEDTDTGQIRAKTGGELSASSLQSPDDWEATCREKRGQGYRGYVANLTETCDPRERSPTHHPGSGGPQHYG